MKRVIVKKVKGSKGKVVKIAAGLATLAVGAYLLYGKGAKSRRLKIKGWAKDMAHEVRKQAKPLAKLDRKVFHQVVDRVADEYRNVKKIDAKELHRVSQGLKEAWATLGASAKTAVSRVKSSYAA